jgi:hypothetical protein
LNGLNRVSDGLENPKLGFLVQIQLENGQIGPNGWVSQVKPCTKGFLAPGQKHGPGHVFGSIHGSNPYRRGAGRLTHQTGRALDFGLGRAGVLEHTGRTLGLVLLGSGRAIGALHGLDKWTGPRPDLDPHGSRALIHAGRLSWLVFHAG